MSFTICERTSVSRYYDINIYFSSQYRSYNKSIPPYLHNRSKSFVVNCLEKRGITLSSYLTGITCQGKGSFSALNFSNNVRESYEVHFGNENEMPKCSCVASLKSSYLCKYFFAIFEKFHHGRSVLYLYFTELVPLLTLTRML